MKQIGQGVQKRMWLYQLKSDSNFCSNTSWFFYSVFQRHRKRKLKPDLDSPDNILQGLPTSTIYRAIWRHKPWFSDYFFLFVVLHQFSRAKKHITGHSDQRSSELWANIHIWDEFQAITMLYIAVYRFWHFFFHLNLLDYPLASCLLIEATLQWLRFPHPGSGT